MLALDWLVKWMQNRLKLHSSNKLTVPSTKKNIVSLNLLFLTILLAFIWPKMWKCGVVNKLEDDIDVNFHSVFRIIAIFDYRPGFTHVLKSSLILILLWEINHHTSSWRRCHRLWSGGCVVQLAFMLCVCV